MRCMLRRASFEQSKGQCRREHMLIWFIRIDCSCGCVAALRFNSFSYTGTFVVYFTEIQTCWQTSPCKKQSCNQAHRRFQPEGGQGLSCEEPFFESQLRVMPRLSRDGRILYLLSYFCHTKNCMGVVWRKMIL